MNTMAVLLITAVAMGLLIGAVLGLLLAPQRTCFEDQIMVWDAASNSTSRCVDADEWRGYQ